jgi:recombination protein RecT
VTTLAKPAGSGTTRGLVDVIEERRESLLKLLPPGVDPERFIQQAVKASHVPGIRACTPSSFLKCVADLAELGLDLSPSLQQAFLIPRFDKRVNAEVCTLLIGYRGLIAMMLRSPEIHSVDAAIVYSNDEFSETRGSRPELIHRPAPLTGPRGHVVGAYAVAYFADRTRTPQWAVMQRAELDAIKTRSDEQRRRKDGSVASSPWQTDFAEMCRKTPIRRLAKYLPIAPDISRIDKAIEVDRETEDWSDYVGQLEPAAIEQGPSRPAPKTGATARLAANLGVRRGQDVAPPEVVADAGAPEEGPAVAAGSPPDRGGTKQLAQAHAAPSPRPVTAGDKITEDDIPF